MSFTEFDNIVARLSGDMADPAESHGHLIGLVCAHPVNAIDQWLVALAQESATGNATAADARDELGRMASDLVAMLTNADPDYQLLLPDDSVALEKRVTSLAHWCQGFLFGLAQGGMSSFEGLPGDCTEILEDISELTRATAENGQEENEQAFFELTEYVRVGTQLIFEELSAINATAQTNTAH